MLQFGKGMERPGQPFAALENQPGNPYVNWVVQTLQNSGLQISKSEMARLPSQWHAMSGQLSQTMRNQAIAGLVIALFRGDGLHQRAL